MYQQNYASIFKTHNKLYPPHQPATMTTRQKLWRYSSVVYDTFAPVYQEKIILVVVLMYTVKFNGAVKRVSLGALFVSADWRVRVFWSSVLVDKPSDSMYVRTIPLSGCIYRRSHYIPFSSQA